ncbi:Alpha/beta hydrolase fold-3 domain protein [Sulfitobacter noctilucae]|uniref:alpha/beta hydrolase n=1 Tax=Sulfitobacter noctilucae TaxID=1342302 RepID=UPI000469A461|nr:alpha/beta hydrolase [Sulfitobacter noctilucae]KIN70675.1 Alpha/beta hydrolase fold-3 domain protein [Sulfitobacter noctilucae]
MDEKLRNSLALAKEELDFQLSPSKSAKDAIGVLNWMVDQTSLALQDAAILVQKDAPYGAAARQKLDVFAPHGGGAAPCFVFLHGGFWQEGDTSVSGFAAANFLQMGWSYVSVGYTLTPEARLTDIVQEVHDALSYLHTHAAALGIDKARIILAGHSAGGHLAAAVLADVLGLGAHRHLAGAVVISGVFELAPIARSYVNDLAQITAEEVEALSPVRFAPAASIPVHIEVGADEPEAFRLQSQVLIETWAAYLPRLTHSVATGRDHFDVLMPLADPQSALVHRIKSMVVPPND